MRGRRADSRDSHQVLARGAKGLDRRLDLRIERGDRFIRRPLSPNTSDTTEANFTWCAIILRCWLSKNR
jgi:hypothetical protein